MAEEKKKEAVEPVEEQVKEPETQEPVEEAIPETVRTLVIQTNGSKVEVVDSQLSALEMESVGRKLVDYAIGLQNAASG